LSPILQGILLGLTLAIMLGPIFVTITQISIEKGARAGLSACTGEWFSDIVIISVCYLFVQKINDLVQDVTFTYWMGLIGGFILIVFGIGAFLNESKIEFKQTKHSTNDYFGFWMKGFLVNTINPFTFIFWIGIISTNVIKSKFTNQEAMMFFASILGVIIITDIAKVLLAKRIRNNLKQTHFNIFTKIAGVGLIIFGISFLVRTQVF
jgi:threonine/homoserine/homoserine lactone efflux protein